MWTFFDFQYGFRPTQSTADIPTVASDRNVGNFNRSGTNWAEALDIFKVCNRVWDTSLTNVSLIEFQVRSLSIFRLLQ